MNILFLTMNDFGNINEHSIYPDLVRCFRKHGHSIVVVTPLEKKLRKNTEMTVTDGIRVIKAKTGNLFNVSMLTKLCSRAFLGARFYKAVRDHTDDRFDLVIYSTPPTTFSSIVKRIKKRDGASSYLMLKDIFPQNAADLGFIRRPGVLFSVMRIFEKQLYRVSDHIGCMSEANIGFLLNQDRWIDKRKVELCPNALEVFPPDSIDRRAVLSKYGIPSDKIIFIYGGGMGKPQGIDFFIDCLEFLHDDPEIHFAVSGTGPYLSDLQKMGEKYPGLITVLKWLPVEEYEKVVGASDVGLIFLNDKFSIPNYPSRLLTYMQAALPVLAATDTATDVGSKAEKGGYGFRCESSAGNEREFAELVCKMKSSELRRKMGVRARKVFEEEYDVEVAYTNIMRHFPAGSSEKM